jgi:hypothetical protein
MLKNEAASLLALRNLRIHPNKTVDIVGVATIRSPEPRRARGGPRTSLLEFLITDFSIAPSQVIHVRISRPHKEALPIVSPGDVVVLYQFPIASMKSRAFGLQSGERSSWAVFERGPDGELGKIPQVRGSPVEIGDGEEAYVGLLKKWYDLLDEKTLAKLEKVSQKALET